MPYYTKDPKRDPNFDNHPCRIVTEAVDGRAEYLAQKRLAFFKDARGYVNSKRLKVTYSATKESSYNRTPFGKGS